MTELVLKGFLSETIHIRVRSNSNPQVGISNEQFFNN